MPESNVTVEAIFSEEADDTEYTVTVQTPVSGGTVQINLAGLPA